ncbi:Epoxyqueuosine reductase [Caulifigura coniformis]|uniref:Epoxyqueuosine reductase n=1 Tax=Caulifigura coniformis TaxID=2527983 RepID=A0A517SAX8_9PLAN|nr:tRNA epoxyqueuosine(34) reductase QueG [Caulifigura coniformis]QDT53274.1 Epoxyqueuosine reductase [Caulifigura coniformis]
MPEVSISPTTPDPAHLADRLKAEARRLGFDLVGIAPAAAPTTTPEFREWLSAGFAGEMHYLERRREAYDHPASMLTEVRTVIMLGVNYYSGDEPEPQPGDGRVARYARIPADYHDVLRARLKELAALLHNAHPRCRTRGVVDTAPLLERDFARRAGLGWFGKNTMLLNKRLGSWFFLAALLTDVELPADAPHDAAHCGTCTRCLEACPTDAFIAPYVLDARRCISYLTIELGARPIEESLLSGMQDWAFGCDICQEVCPWNRKAPLAEDQAFRAGPENSSLRLAPLLEMDESRFQQQFGQTPLARPGLEALTRSACLAVGNAGTLEDLPTLAAAKASASPLIRDAAGWAEARLRDRAGSRGEFAENNECADLAVKSDAMHAGESNARGHSGSR